jgi:hypothetical protein
MRVVMNREMMIGSPQVGSDPDSHLPIAHALSNDPSLDRSYHAMDCKLGFIILCKLLFADLVYFPIRFS